LVPSVVVTELPPPPLSASTEHVTTPAAVTAETLFVPLHVVVVSRV
jgi:hypothetical protein